MFKASRERLNADMDTSILTTTIRTRVSDLTGRRISFNGWRTKEERRNSISMNSDNGGSPKGRRGERRTEQRG